MSLAADERCDPPPALNQGRTMQEFLAESDVHGWPSFRDEEVCTRAALPCPVAQSQRPQAAASSTHALAHGRLCGRTCACCARRARLSRRTVRTWATTCPTGRATAIASTSSPSPAF
eukprot:1741338-Prymnesium_polylepis.1